MWEFNYIQHYASPYYNPDKAHEYYEKHKEVSNKVYKKDLSNGQYASPYYDPVKAHEYYERTKQLKGRSKSSKTLSEEGAAVNANVRENINAERDSKLAEENERYRREREIRSDATKRTMEQHRLIMNQRITSLQNVIKRMPDNMKNSEIPKIKATIQKLREDNDKKRASIQEKYKTESAKASQASKETKAKIRQDAKDIYEKERERILNTENLYKVKKKR